jgi:hypothetical protein
MFFNISKTGNTVFWTRCSIGICSVAQRGGVPFKRSQDATEIKRFWFTDEAEDTRMRQCMQRTQQEILRLVIRPNHGHISGQQVVLTLTIV